MAVPRITPRSARRLPTFINSGSTSVVTRKGQITIPAEIRHELGLELGERVSIRLEGSTIIVKRSADLVDELYGILAEYADPANRTRDIQEIIDEEHEVIAQAIVEDVLEELESE